MDAMRTHCPPDELLAADELDEADELAVDEALPELLAAVLLELLLLELLLELLLLLEPLLLEPLLLLVPDGTQPAAFPAEAQTSDPQSTGAA
jgi:hypothetical protein